MSVNVSGARACLGARTLERAYGEYEGNGVPPILEKTVRRRSGSRLGARPATALTGLIPRTDARPGTFVATLLTTNAPQPAKSNRSVL